jgi:hypothetical protein
MKSALPRRTATTRDCRRPNGVAGSKGEARSAESSIHFAPSSSRPFRPRDHSVFNNLLTTSRIAAFRHHSDIAMRKIRIAEFGISPMSFKATLIKSALPRHRDVPLASQSRK